MSIVGYDPGALTRLADQLATAAVHLEDLTRHPALNGEPLHLRQVIEATEVLRWWAARARGIATCDVMERVRHLDLPAVPLTDVPLRQALAHRWQHDGLALVEVDLPQRVVRGPGLVAAAQAVVASDRPLSDDDLLWLTALADGADDPVSAWSMTVLIGALGTRLQRRQANDPPEVAVEQAWRSLIRAASSQPVVIRHVVESLPPTVAAPVLAQAHVHGTVLGDVAVDLLERWERQRWWVLGRHTPMNPVDHVLAAVVHDAEALTRVWQERRERPGLLLYGPNHVHHMAAFVRALTDPNHVATEVAAARLLPLATYARSIPHDGAADLAGLSDHLVLAPGFGDAPEVRWWQVRDAVAVASAPWMVWLTSATAPWGDTSAQGVDLLTWLGETPGAASALARELGPALQRRAAELPDDPADRFDAIERMAWTIGAVDAVVEGADPPSDAGLELLRGLVALSVGHVAGAAAAAATAVVAPPLAGVARTVSSGRVTDALEGDDTAEDRHRAVARLASLDRRATAAAALVAVVAADQRRRGWLAPEVPPPPPPTPRSGRDPGAPDPLEAWLSHLDHLDDRLVRPDARRELRQAWAAVTPADQRAAIDRGRSHVSG